MKKFCLLIFVLILSALVFSTAFAQKDDTFMDPEEDWTEYFNSYDRCYQLLDEYNADLQPYLDGTAPTDSQKWRNLRQDLRWDGAVTCGYIMSVIEPDEWSEYTSELLYSSYYQLMAIEFTIQSIQNKNDADLLSLADQMYAASMEMEAKIPDR